MARSHHFPAYPRRAHSSGQARIRLGGKDVYLGAFNSKDSRQRYAELATRFATEKPIGKGKSVPTVQEVWARFFEHAEKSLPEKELWHFARISKAVYRLYGSMLASQFDTAALSMLRKAFASGSWRTPEEAAHARSKPWSRSQINKAVHRIRRVWRWAEQQGNLIPIGSWAGLLALDPIRSTDRAFVSTKRRLGIDRPALLAILPYLSPMVAALAELQFWSGMRPSEAVRIKPKNIEQGEDVWLYWLSGNKNDWRPGREEEAVVLGPEAIRVLSPWLAAAKLKGDDAPIFPSVKTGRMYTTGGYGQALASAFRKHPELVKFTAYQLRHAAKRRVRRELGLDAARAALRQSSIQTTDRYDSERDMEIAKDVAKKTG